MRTERMTWRCAIAAIGYCLFTSGGSFAADVQPAPAPEVRKLAVLLNYAASPILTAEDLVGQLSDPTQSPQAAQLALRLQSPERASLLLTKRLPTEYRATLPEGDPDEMLHRYVVLEYPDTATTMAAKVVLEKDPLVLFVKESTFSQFSVAPVDPLFATAPQIQNYQWGINNPLNLKSAWNSVRGTAYIADLDNGIQNGNPNSNPATPLHEDLGQPWRPIFNFNIAGGNDVDEHPEQVSGRIVGHGTHTAGIIAAATTQASVRPGYPNPVKLGGAGVCWYCSLMIVKVSRIVGGLIQLDDMVDLPNAINWAATSGAQAINLSLGGLDHHCPTNPYDAYCFALSSATLKEVVIAAAAGNSDVHSGGNGHALGTTLDFPALSQYTIAVGAIQSYSGVRGNLWTEEAPNIGNYGSSTGPGMETRGILAPGRDVLSTFYYGQVWNAGARCGSTTAQGTSKGPNYGVCTGTSMATPHITGIVGLLRTINPLLTRSQITSALLSSGDNAASPNTTRGYGVPNVSTAVNTVLATTNRLTPLFSHYSSVAWDHFYTVAPQMARASIAYGLLPYAVAPTTYAPYGTAIAEYPQFPQYQLINYVSPRAQVWVFSTHVNPFNGTVELLPIYRLSWKCGDPGTSVCGSNSKHVSHFYSTDLSEVLTYLGVNHYSGNGMEGYVYPLSLAQPPNTTLLMRAYNPSLDDYALFPQQEQANMASQGYTQALTNLGYVYLNSGSRPAY